MSWPSARLLAVASAWRARSAARRCAVLLGGVAQLLVVEARAAEVGLLAGGLAVGVGELLADGVEHEHRVDDPDAGGEVLAAVEHPAVASVGGAVAQRCVDAQLERAASCARAASASSSESSLSGGQPSAAAASARRSAVR